jgi:hypothetical protein
MNDETTPIQPSFDANGSPPAPEVTSKTDSPVEAADDVVDAALIAESRGEPTRPLREIIAEIESSEKPPAEPTNVIEATEACRQADPELAGMPAQQEREPLVFKREDLDTIDGLTFHESGQTKAIEIATRAQKTLISLAQGYTPNQILGAVLQACGIEGQVQIHTHPVTQTLTLWKGKGQPASAGAGVPSKSHLTTDDVLKLHESTCAAAREIIRVKNNDYTDGSVDPFANFRSAETIGVKAETGVLVRMLDKIKRIQTFVNKGTLQVKGESVEDAIQDIINYAVLLKGIIVERRLQEVA